MRLTSRLYAMYGFFWYLSRIRERLNVRKRAKATRGGSADPSEDDGSEELVPMLAHNADGRHAQLELQPELHMQPSAVALHRMPPCLPAMQPGRGECCNMSAISLLATQTFALRNCG